MNDNLGDTLFDQLERPLLDWMREPPENKKPNSDLFCILVGDDKTVVFVFQPQLSKVIFEYK